LQQQGQLFAVPYTYSTMGIIYDKRQFSRPPDSMNVLWDPRYRHKVLDFNSGQHNFSFAALASGISQPFQLDAAQQAAMVQAADCAAAQCAYFYSLPEEATELFIRHKVAVMFGNYGTQQLNSLRQAGADVGYAIPREGVLAWLDCWAMTRQHATAAGAAMDQLHAGALGQRAAAHRQGLANTLRPVPSCRRSRVLWLQPVENANRREALWQKIYSGDLPGSF
jgi:putative spermidine/putrescine transport system substrate-binding protein